MIAIASQLLAAGCGEAARQPGGGPELIVAAASDLALAFEELGRLFEQETGVKVTFSFGSTGNLAKQIEHGAPVDVFAAANISFIEDLEKKGLIIPDTKEVYARGRITLWTRGDSPLRTERIEDLAGREVSRVAIANPAHAPYGMAAREALQAAGVWERVEPKLVLAENVRQALQFAETGNTDMAIVALSLSTGSAGRWALIPESLHSPIDQALAIIRASRHENQARLFTAFLRGEKGRAIMQKYGFIQQGSGVGGRGSGVGGQGF
ncbi:MAG TPA: molybdate ABC transporter substrate-binding protein [Blastocatellia bacterium]|nr:molybdate ABC transporter substrate-binding protein [Blastocatellia bacterium]